MAVAGGLSAVAGSAVTLAAVAAAIVTGSKCPPSPWSEMGLVLAMAGILIAMIPMLMPSKVGRRACSAVNGHDASRESGEDAHVTRDECP